ncbi:MAG: YjbQ family protein, partial [Candidatus Omnitrophica bacterium]|nr:YjbQ family protein [Candidatus Omnitrophota bacterium]
MRKEYKEIILNSTKRTEIIDVTRDVKKVLGDNSKKCGMCIVYVPHTTAAITINENADPDV